MFSTTESRAIAGSFGTGSAACATAHLTAAADSRFAEPSLNGWHNTARQEQNEQDQDHAEDQRGLQRVVAAEQLLDGFQTQNKLEVGQREGADDRSNQRTGATDDDPDDDFG